MSVFPAQAGRYLTKCTSPTVETAEGIVMLTSVVELFPVCRTKEQPEGLPTTVEVALCFQTLMKDFTKEEYL